MKNVIIALSVLLSACSKSSSSHSYNLSVNYANAVNSAQSIDPSTAPLSLFTGSVGVEAYMYQPSAGSTNLGNSGWVSWNLLPYGTSQNFLMKGGQAIDLSTLGGSIDYSDLSASGLGAFRLDFIFAEGMPNVVMPDANSTVCGLDILYGTLGQAAQAFPALTFLDPSTPPGPLPNCFMEPYYSGQAMGAVGNEIFALVARNDWFPTPDVVTITINNGSLVCWNTENPLNAFQVEVLDTLFQQEVNTPSNPIWTLGKYDEAGCGGNAIAIVMLSPMTTDVAQITLSETGTLNPPVTTPNGNSIPQAQAITVGSNLKATMNFNLTPSDISNWSTISDPSKFYGCAVGVDAGCIFVNGGGYETIQMAPSGNGAPWGFSVDIEAQ